MITLDRVRELNYDHHRRMTETHLARVRAGVANDTARIDDQSYRWLLRKVPTCERLLELGSASGQQWPLLSAIYPNALLFGIDLYEPLVMNACERGLHIALGFVEDMHMFGDGQFDLVCSRHVMEHLGDLEKGISEVLRVTMSGGFIAQVTPNMDFDNEPSHLNLLNTDEWAEVWEKTGLVRILSAQKHPFHGGEVHLVAQKL